MSIVGRDQFSRTVASGWGTADTGGAWTAIGAATELAVTGNAATLSPPNGSTRGAILAVASRDQYALFRVKLGTLPASSNTAVWASLRRVDANNTYNFVATITSAAQVSLQLTKIVAGVTTVLAADAATHIASADGDPLAAGEWFWIRAEAVGANPTTVRIKAWKDGDIEQGFWFSSVTDSAAALQVSASFAISTFAAIASPPVISIDDLTVADAAVTYSMSFAMAGASVATSRFPPDTSISYVAVPAVSRPGLLSPITDPTWGTRITRISNTNIWRNIYPKVQPWNSDGTKLLLGLPGNPRPFVHGTTYANLKTMQTGNNPCWSNTDPDKIFNTDQNATPSTFRYVLYSTEVFTTIRTFTGYTQLTLGEYEGRADDSQRYWPMVATLVAGSVPTIMIYDATLDSIIATRTTTLRVNNVGMTRTGTYAIIQYGANGTGAEQGTWLANGRTLVNIRQLYTTTAHGDVCLDFAGNDVWVQANPPYMEVLATGVRATLLNGHNPEAMRNGHVSGCAYNRNGWAYISNHDTVLAAGQPGMDQVMALKLDGSGTVEVFAHAHHGDSSVYNADPFAVPSRDGKQVTFGSEWDGDKNTQVYGFVAEMA